MGLENGFRFNEEPWVWLAAIAAFSAVIIGDLAYWVKNPHEPTFKESAIQSSI
jgi:tellurite resistance protein TerC